MSNENDYATCGGRPLIVQWAINRHLFYTFEIDTDEVEKVLPQGMAIIEIRPGISLLSVGVLRYEPGQFHAASPVFVELVGAIHVAPDLSIRMPISNMTFFSFSVFSDSEDFVEQEGHTLYTPTRHVPSLRFDFTPDELGVDVKDDEGPILSVPNEHKPSAYAHKEMWGQHFTNTKGLQHGLWEWDGTLYEHMRPSRGWKLFPHSFWKGIDIRRVRGCYRQMLLEPGTLCTERFYSMSLVQE